jgi:hypothetical protein
MDPKTSRGLWLLPTYNRATTNIPRFINACRATNTSTPIAIVVDDADYAAHHEEYDALDLPDGWFVHVVKGGCCAEATEQALHDLCDAMDYIGWLADDLIPETDGWDVKCIESLTGWNVVSTDDGKFAPNKMNGATIWSGELVRAVGYLFPAGLKHFFIDTVWEELGRLMNIWTIRMDIMVRHVHASWSGAADETLVRTNSFWNYDDRAFINWKQNDRLAAANRVGNLLVEYGVSKPLPRLDGVSVLIATPCGDGTYERLYVSSLFGTIEALRQCGAVVNFAEMPYCSDIALARAKLYGMFLRSDFTHMLMIDSDMGWRPTDVVQLFAHKRDFVAVAGPRKVFPESFAVQNTDAAGRAQMLRQEADSGLFEVSHIGMAFALVTKEWAERMRDAHQDLQYAGDDGRPEYAIFNPLVANKRYMSEDFAACHRWRAIGGHIYVDPSISLQHVGTYVWEGSWGNHLISTAKLRTLAA